jgi:hypothetical protein
MSKGMRARAVVPAVLGLLLLAGLFWLQLRTVEERPNVAESTDSPYVERPSIPTERDAVADRGDAAGDPASIDLRDAPQTFRNSTLLFAIRRAGFYCADLVSAQESVDGVWAASCSDMLGYVVTLRGAGQFDVHPVAHYFDSVAPVLIERDRPLDPGSLAPQPLRK